MKLFESSVSLGHPVENLPKNIAACYEDLQIYVHNLK